MFSIFLYCFWEISIWIMIKWIWDNTYCSQHSNGRKKQEDCWEAQRKLISTNLRKGRVVKCWTRVKISCCCWILLRVENSQFGVADFNNLSCSQLISSVTISDFQFYNDCQVFRYCWIMLRVEEYQFRVADFNNLSCLQWLSNFLRLSILQ